MKIKYRFLVVGALITILLVLPARLLLEHNSDKNGFLDLIYFGQVSKGSVLPEVRELSLEPLTQIGYDGQFYAQLALRPALKDKALLQALDNPKYRARRIGLPFLAFCLGLGEAPWILHVYALINFGFWFLLLALIIRFIGFKTYRDVLLAVALLWSTGTLISVSRALTDFPAVVLGVLAVFFNSRWFLASIFFGFSGLVKETSLLCFAAMSWPNRPQGYDLKRLTLSFLIMGLPIVLWLLYLNFHLVTGSVTGIQNFSFPLSGIYSKFNSAIYDLVKDWSNTSILWRARLFFEVICPLSLVIQAVYLIAKPRVCSEIWRFGIGFVLLLFVLGGSVWAEQYAYCRVLLPLTFSFNLLIHKHEFGTRFKALYLAGNGGMFYMALKYMI